VAVNNFLIFGAMQQMTVLRCFVTR